MGYYTSYELRIEIDGSTNNETSEQVIEELVKEYKGAGYALDENGDTAESTKWYEHDEDLTEFSKKYPDYLFHLSGTGENNGDMWRCTYVNGKRHLRHAEITFAPFDPNKLI